MRCSTARNAPAQRCTTQSGSAQRRDQASTCASRGQSAASPATTTAAGTAAAPAQDFPHHCKHAAGPGTRRPVAAGSTRRQWTIRGMPAMKSTAIVTTIGLPLGSACAHAAGGPDSFGYRWSSSDDPGGPQAYWIDISATGTPVIGCPRVSRNCHPGIARCPGIASPEPPRI